MPAGMPPLAPPVPPGGQMMGMAGGGGVPQIPEAPPVLDPSMIQQPEPDFSRLESSALVKEINLSKEEKDRIRAKLKDEIGRSVRGLKGRNEKIKKWRKAYREERDSKTFPFKDCSNVAVPLTAPDTDQIAARTIRVLTTTDPLFVVMPSRDQDTPLEELQSIQKYMKAELSDPRMGFDRSVEDFIHGLCQTGVGIAKVFWDTKTRTVYRYEVTADAEPSPVSGVLQGTPKIEKTEEVVYEGNVFEPVKPEDFFYPPECHEDPDLIEKAFWVAHRFTETQADMDRKAKIPVADGGYYKDAVKRLKDQDERRTPSDTSSFVDKETLAEVSGEVAEDKQGAQVTNYEVHIRMSLEDQKEGPQTSRDCIIIYNDSGDGEILSARYNFFFHGKRPFVRAPFHEVGTFWGRGVPERLQHVQTIANDLVNIGIDAGLWANMPMFKKKKDALMARGKQDEILPGKVLMVDELGDFERIDMGDTSGSVFQFLPIVKEFGQKASGVSDFLAGMEGERGNRESAAGAGQRTGNSSPLFDVLLGCVRRALEEAAELMFWNCWQFKPDGDEYQEMADDGSYVKQLFKMPPKAGGRYRFRIVASSVAANPEVRKQTVQHLMGLLEPAEQQMLQTVGQITDPNTPDMIRELLLTAMSRKSRQLKQIVESFDLPGSAAMVPDWDQIWQKNEQAVLQGIEQQKQQMAQQPPPLDETIARVIFNNWELMPAEIKGETYKRLGFPIPPDVQAEIDERAQRFGQGGQDAGNQAPGDDMGQPGPGGQEAPPEAPAGM